MVDIFFFPLVEIQFADLLGRSRMEGGITCLTVDSSVNPPSLSSDRHVIIGIDRNNSARKRNITINYAHRILRAGRDGLFSS